MRATSLFTLELNVAFIYIISDLLTYLPSPDLEDLLVAVGAVQSNDPRIRKSEQSEYRDQKAHASEEDDYWD